VVLAQQLPATSDLRVEVDSVVSRLRKLESETEAVPAK
jgi:hypothetical protein